MTYMPADNLRNQQQQIDQRFHEYKLAALTGLMVNWRQADTLEGLAVTCDKVARAMERMDAAESGQ